MKDLPLVALFFGYKVIPIYYYNQTKLIFYKTWFQPWPVWLSWLECHPVNQKIAELQAQSLVGANASVVGSVPGCTWNRGRETTNWCFCLEWMFLFSLSLCPSLSKSNKKNPQVRGENHNLYPCQRPAQIRSLGNSSSWDFPRKAKQAATHPLSFQKELSAFMPPPREDPVHFCQGICDTQQNLWNSSIANPIATHSTPYSF